MNYCVLRTFGTSKQTQILAVMSTQTSQQQRLKTIYSNLPSKEYECPCNAPSSVLHSSDARIACSNPDRDIHVALSVNSKVSLSLVQMTEHGVTKKSSDLSALDLKGHRLMALQGPGYQKVVTI